MACVRRFPQKEASQMHKTYLAEALVKINMLKQQGIKPNMSELSRETGLDRHTLKKYFDEGGKFNKERSPKGSKYDALEETISERMSIEGVTIKSLWEHLLDEKAEQAKALSYRGLVSYVRNKGHGGAAAERLAAHPRFETAPGAQLQVDWKESLSVKTKSGETIEFNVFSATLSWSRYHFFVYSTGKGAADFIRCLISVLKELGAMPREIVADNMAAIVSCRGGTRRKLPQIVQLEKDLGVRIRLCKPRTPETKGKVESSNRFVNRLRAYDGLIADEGELKAKTARIQSRSNAEANGETGVPPSALLMKERSSLGALPNALMLESYASESYVTAKVPQTMLARCRGKWYSVPRAMIGKRAVAIPSEGKVYVFDSAGLLVAEHAESKAKTNYQEAHYAEALAGKGIAEDEISGMAEEQIGRLSSL